VYLQVDADVSEKHAVYQHVYVSLVFDNAGSAKEFMQRQIGWEDNHE
jgi:hypothetical protein